MRPVPDFARDEQVLGTADYFAPEQSVNSQTVDGRADIYGLGCTLYFLLTGHPPFRGDSALELMTAHHRQSPASVLIDRPDAPPALVAICEKMMEKSPENRYQSCAEVAEALNRWLESERAAGRGDSRERSAKLDAAALRDTDPNLQETARINNAPGRPTASSDVLSPRHNTGHDLSRLLDSDVLATPTPPRPPTPPPQAPPVVSPPRTAQSGSNPTVLPIAQAARKALVAPLSARALRALDERPSRRRGAPLPAPARRPGS